MNRSNRSLLLTVFAAFALMLSACQTGPIYSPPKPQLAEAAPNKITDQVNNAAARAPKELPSVKIGILLPLSGKHETLGQSMLKAAQMALFDLGHANFQLLPRDTQGQPEIAAAAARDAIDNGAEIILGPIFGTAAKAVQPVVQSRGINMISFSTDWTVAGRNSYIMGFSPFDQVDRIIEYASSRGLSDFGAIFPNDAYGEAVRSAYRNAASQNRINTIRSIYLTPNSSTVTSQIRELSDYDRRMALKEQGKTIVGGGHAYKVPGEDLPFEAVFMPLGGQFARSVSSILSQYDMRPREVRRIGTGLWDDTSLATEPAMNGAWFASPNPRSSDQFRAKFASIYGYQPPRLTTLAYDATALAGVLARKGFAQGNRPAYDTASITNPNGFAGIDGIFRFGSNGVVERGLAVLEYRNGSIVMIDAAPKTFIKQRTFQPASGSPVTSPSSQTGHNKSFRF